MRLRPTKLEEWLRDYYFEAGIDISSSGVEPYTLAELLPLIKTDPAELSAISFRDSRSAGANHLRRLIADRYRIEDASRVIVTNGSTEAQFLVLMSALSAGDEVVVLVPAYHSLIEIVRAKGCRLVPWRLRSTNGFRPALDELEQLVTRNTKMLIVNFPHNPTGVTVTFEEQQQMLAIVGRYECILFWDGVFEDLVFEGDKLPPIASIYGKGISFGSVSKSLGLPGLRVGWGLLPSYEYVKAAVTVRDYTTLALSPLVEFIAERVLQHVDSVMAPRLGTAATNRSYFLQWMSEHKCIISCDHLGGGVIGFPRLIGVDNTERFCDRLMRERRVLVVPGECFGMPGFVRLGFGGNSDQLRLGLHALATAIGGEVVDGR